MADVAAALRSWSATAASNSPAGGTVIGSGLDDNLRQIQATVRQYLASQGTNMASATTVDLSTADGSYVKISGSTTITGFGTEGAGISYLLEFISTPIITHNGTSLILPGAANITAAAGDLMLVVSEGSGNWRCAFYQPATSTPVEKLPTTKGDLLAATAAQTLARVAVGTDGQYLKANSSVAAGVSWASLPTIGITLGTQQVSTSGTAINFTGFPAGTKRITVMFVGVSMNGTHQMILQIGPSGGVETSGYTGARQTSGTAGQYNSAGFTLTSAGQGATNVVDGRCVLNLENATAFRWVGDHLLGGTDSAYVDWGAGSKTLLAELTQLTITTVAGTAAFDAGVINVSYE